MSDAPAGPDIDLARRSSGRVFDNARPKRLGVAVSGGGDSMALLDLMVWHGNRLGFEVLAVTVNHGLRPEAGAEAAFVAKHCTARGLSHDTLAWTGWDGRGNLQARARQARYALMADWARGRGVDWVALGHTCDDQAENFLIRLGRAAGVDGLATMRGRFGAADLTWIRPLLPLSRADCRAYLRARDIAWCEDPSNEDSRFERVRARDALAALGPLGIDAQTLKRVSDNLGAAKSALDHYARAEAARRVRQDRGDVVLNLPRDGSVPDDIRRRLVVGALRFVSGAGYAPRQSALDELDAAIAAGDSFTLSGCIVTPEPKPDPGPDAAAGHLRVAREWNAVRDLIAPADQPWDGRWRATGPFDAGLELRALGAAGLVQCPAWRETGLPRQSLLAAPALWRGDTLVAAPLAGLANGWCVNLAQGRRSFVENMLSD